MGAGSSFGGGSFDGSRQCLTLQAEGERECVRDQARGDVVEPTVTDVPLTENGHQLEGMSSGERRATHAAAG
jgi:hypothetical protein